MKKIALATMLALFASVSAQAQKKPSTPPPSINPEVGFVDAKPRYPELKLANVDLTGSFTVFRSAVQWTMPRYDLSPRGQNQVAVTNGGNAHLVTWSHNGSSVSLTTQPLTASANQASEIRFSPDGTKIAVSYHSDSTIRIFSAATRSQLQSLVAPPVYSMTWLDSGDAIALIDPYEWRKIKIVSIADGSVTEHAFPAGDLRQLDSARNSDGILATYMENGAVPTSHYFGRWDNGTLTQAKIAQGFEANYNCDESRIVYKTVGTRAATVVYNVATNTTNVMTNNGDVRRVDFMPTC